METSDWITVLAIIAAPVFAVQIQKWLEGAREKRRRQLEVFYTLMATRAARLSVPHVQGLNRIDIEFCDRKIFRIPLPSRSERAVRLSWKSYLDHLGIPAREMDAKLWAERREEFFLDLLYEMSRTLGYDFDKVDLRRGMYSPMAHADEENLNMEVRKLFVEILKGERSIPVTIAAPNALGSTEPDPELERISDLLNASLIAQPPPSSFEERIDVGDGSDNE